MLDLIPGEPAEVMLFDIARRVRLTGGPRLLVGRGGGQVQSLGIADEPSQAAEQNGLSCPPSCCAAERVYRWYRFDLDTASEWLTEGQIDGYLQHSARRELGWVTTTISAWSYRRSVAAEPIFSARRVVWDDGCDFAIYADLLWGQLPRAKKALDREPK